MSNHLILNRFFSQANLVNFFKDGTTSVIETCVENYLKKDGAVSNSDIFSEIYAFLKKNYRNEYFYKNTLFNKLLIGRHSLNTTTAITELPIHKSKADFIMINGKAVVYEIKTEDV